MIAQTKRCSASVIRRDTYRYTGRGRGGFSMHYTEAQCHRKATHGEWCWQHKDGKTMKVRFPI